MCDKNPESLSQRGLVWYRVLTDRRTGRQTDKIKDKITIASTRLAIGAVARKNLLLSLAQETVLAQKDLVNRRRRVQWWLVDSSAERALVITLAPAHADVLFNDSAGRTDAATAGQRQTRLLIYSAYYFRSARAVCLPAGDDAVDDIQE